MITLASPAREAETQRAPGRVASGVFMRLVSLWWEFCPPRLDSNIRILLRRMQLFFVERMKVLIPSDLHVCNQSYIPSGVSLRAPVSRLSYSFLTSTEAHSSK